MSGNDALQRIVDEYEMARVRRVWAFSRDHSDWDTLETCFHPEATVVVSWYEGSAKGFIERSKEAAKHRKPEERSAHSLGNFRAAARRNRGVLETDVQILNRDYLDGHLFDCTCYGRFYDFMEKRDGVWRIARWTCIYDKDRLDPVHAAVGAGVVLPGARLQRSGKRRRVHEASTEEERPHGTHRPDHGRQRRRKAAARRRRSVAGRRLTQQFGIRVDAGLATRSRGQTEDGMKFGIFDYIDRRDEPLARTFAERFELIQAAEAAGFYGYHITEHHATPLSGTPSPSVFLAAAAQHTRRIRLGALLFLLPLYHPLRLLEELCMVDHLEPGPARHRGGSRHFPLRVRLLRRIDRAERRRVRGGA